MPRVTAYIRDGDMELWKATPNKAQLIHDALHSNPKTVKKAVNNEFPTIGGEQACCANPAPCKHWSWNGDSQKWVNNLSGREKDA